MSTPLSSSTSLPIPSALTPRGWVLTSAAMCRKCVTSMPTSADANPTRSTSLRAATSSSVRPRTVATSDRYNGRPRLRARRSRSAVAESRPMSTWTSASAPRSTSSMRWAEKSRRRRVSRPSASPSGDGTRWIAMSHSVCTPSSGASHPGPTGWPGRRRSAWPRTMRSPRVAYCGCSHQATSMLWSRPSATASKSAWPLRRWAVMPSAARRSAA